MRPPSVPVADAGHVKYCPMFLRRFPRHLLASLLMAALLLQVLLPAIAGLQTGPGARWIEVCAGSGIKWVKSDLAGADTPSDLPAGHADHCALCAVTGPVPEFDATRFLPASQFARLALPASVSPVTAYPGHDLRSRAPPVFS